MRVVYNEYRTNRAHQAKSLCLFLKLTDQRSRTKQPDRKGLSAQGIARTYGVLEQSYYPNMSGRDHLAPGFVNGFQGSGTKRMS